MKLDEQRVVGEAGGGIRYLRGESPAATAFLPDGCAAAIVTDPPYGTGTASSIYGRRRTDGRAIAIANDADLSALERTAPEMARLLTPGGVCLVFCAPTMRYAAEEALASAGLDPIHSVPWDKGAPGISYRVRYAYEDCVLAVHPEYDPWDTRDTLIVPLRVPRVKDPEHPNEKPVALLRKLVRWACPTGGLVVDHFAGIASVGLACVAEGCDYVGVECDPQWWPVGERRIAGALGREHHAIAQHTLFRDAA